MLIFLFIPDDILNNTSRVYSLAWISYWLQPYFYLFGSPIKHNDRNWFHLPSEVIGY